MLVGASTVTSLAGWVAGALVLISGMPQAIRLIRTRDTEGVASWTYTLWTSVAIWWCAWGLSVPAWPTTVANALAIPVLGTSVLVLAPGRVQLGMIVVSIPAAALCAWLVPGVALTIASGLLLLLTVPSIIAVARPHANVSGVSAATWLLVLVTNLLWVMFDLGIGQPGAAFPSAVGAVGALVILVRLRILAARHHHHHHHQRDPT